LLKLGYDRHGSDGRIGRTFSPRTHHARAYPYNRFPRLIRPQRPQTPKLALARARCVSIETARGSIVSILVNPGANRVSLIFCTAWLAAPRGYPRNCFSSREDPRSSGVRLSNARCSDSEKSVPESTVHVHSSARSLWTRHCALDCNEMIKGVLRSIAQTIHAFLIEVGPASLLRRHDRTASCAVDARAGAT
jgi:hypothetical protein